MCLGRWPPRPVLSNHEPWRWWSTTTLIEWRDSTFSIFQPWVASNFVSRNHLGSTYHNLRMSANTDAKIFQMLNFCPCQKMAPKALSKNWRNQPSKVLSFSISRNCSSPAPRSCCNVRFFISTTGTQTLPKAPKYRVWWIFGHRMEMIMAEPCWALASTFDSHTGCLGIWGHLAFRIENSHWCHCKLTK